jgi:hypothetical protein
MDEQQRGLLPRGASSAARPKREKISPPASLETQRHREEKKTFGAFSSIGVPLLENAPNRS